MTNCCVRGCRNRSDAMLRISFFVFPKAAAVRSKWIKFCGRQASWLPTKNSKMCGIHFDKESLKSLPRLKWVPTLSPCPNPIENEAKTKSVTVENEPMLEDFDLNRVKSEAGDDLNRRPEPDTTSDSVVKITSIGKSSGKRVVVKKIRGKAQPVPVQLIVANKSAANERLLTKQVKITHVPSNDEDEPTVPAPVLEPKIKLEPGLESPEASMVSPTKCEFGKPITVRTSTGRTLTLKPIPLIKTDKLQAGGAKMNQIVMNGKRNIQFIPVGSPPLKARKVDANSHLQLKKFSFREIVDILNAVIRDEKSVVELSFDYQCPQSQLALIVSSHQRIMDGDTSTDNNRLYPQFYRDLFTETLYEWYRRFRSVKLVEDITEDDILERAGTIQNLFGIQIFSDVFKNPEILHQMYEEREDDGPTQMRPHMLWHIFEDLKNQYPIDFYERIISKIDGKTKIVVPVEVPQASPIIKHDVDSYMDAFRHLLSLIKFCKSVNRRDYLKELNSLKEFLVEEMYGNLTEA